MLNFEEDAKAPITVSEADLSELGQYAKEQIELENSIEEKENEVKRLKERLQDVSEYKIPEIMIRCGLSEFKTADMRKVTVSKYYSAKITDDTKAEAFSWLEKNGHMDIVKHNIIVPLPRGSSDQAVAVQEALISMGVTFSDEQSIHPQTLKAFVKEQVEAGTDLPLEAFKVYIGNRTKIK